MPKKSYSEKNHELRKTIELKISEKLSRKGVESKFSSTKVLKVREAQFNLDNGRYLVEVGCDELIDNKGYTYSFEVLETEQFCELADEIL